MVDLCSPQGVGALLSQVLREGGSPISKRKLAEEGEGERVTPRKKLRDMGPPSTVSKESSLCFSSFLSRVKSFSSLSWIRPSAPQLCPLQLAARGWESSPSEGEWMARCVSCRAPLYLSLPEPSSPAYTQLYLKQSSRVISAHAEFCPWQLASCPPAWTQVSLSDSVSSLLTVVNKLAELGTQLPHLRGGAVEEVRSLLSPGVTAILQRMGGEGVVLETAALLALCGWRRGEGSLDIITDIWGVRRVGLWLFTNLQEYEDRVEAERVSEELAAQISPTSRRQGRHTRSKGRDKEHKEELLGKRKEGDKEHKEEGLGQRKEGEREIDVGKRTFHPITEHVGWHPLREGWRILESLVNQLFQESTELSQSSCADSDAESHTGINSRKDSLEPRDVLYKVMNLLDDC